MLVSHWQGFYGLHSDDQRGFNAFKTVVQRLKERDPEGANTRWRKCSEITTYAIARDMADLRVEGETVTLTMPVQVPELTLRLTHTEPQTIRVDGVPLRRVERQAHLESGTYLVDGRNVLVAFDPQGQQAHLVVEPVQV